MVEMAASESHLSVITHRTSRSSADTRDVNICVESTESVVTEKGGIAEHIWLHLTPVKLTCQTPADWKKPTQSQSALHAFCTTSMTLSTATALHIPYLRRRVQLVPLIITSSLWADIQVNKTRAGRTFCCHAIGLGRLVFEPLSRRRTG